MLMIHYLCVPLCVILLTFGASTNPSTCPDNRFGESCQLQCRCSDNSTCDQRSGACREGCMSGWSGTLCQRENKAYGLRASYRAQSDMLFGNLTNATTDDRADTCITSIMKRAGWWRIELPEEQWIYSLAINTGNVSFRSWKVHVSMYESLFWMTPCTILNYEGSYAEFTCDKPVFGKHIGVMNMDGPVTICEFQIFVCSSHTYGVEDCSRCRCSDQEEVCDNVYGTCISGCAEGWTGSSCEKACSKTYGKNCIHRCGHCLHDNPCDPVNGTCSGGCQVGWTGPTCHTRCPSGTYGRNCDLTCGHCSDNTTCLSHNGTCSMGCAEGWMGSTCVAKCDYLRYGKDCGLQCGQCLAGTGCDRKTGMCAATCDPGWEGVFCNQECLSGRYGHDCLLKCGKCINTGCDRVNGSCGAAGCQLGWSGEICDIECKRGYFGPNCYRECGKCVGGVICDPLDGTCGTDCSPGYVGDQCITTCPDGTWGDNCSQTCGLCYRNRPCSPVNGLCVGGCFVGYSGKYCKFTPEFEDVSSNVVMPVMMITFAIVGPTLCLLFICLVFKWNRDEVNIPHPEKENTEALLSADTEHP